LTTPDFTEKLNSNLVQYPPKKGDVGLVMEMICPDDHRKGCGYSCHIVISSDETLDPKERCTSICPKCKEFLVLYWGQYMIFGIKMRGPGLHETKQGQKLKRDRLWRSKVLSEKQWENVQPVSINNPEKIRNPTPGGPLDPNSKFNKGKKKVRKHYT
jgi:hypothetical protein